MSPEKTMVRDFLLKEWDPIGVGDSPGAENEYNGYVDSILTLLKQGKAQEDLFNYMWWMETDHMGLDGDRATTAEKAHSLYTRFHNPH